MNRINNLFQEKKKNILSIYFTAGYPKLNDTCKILLALQNAGVDMVEIGIPFSDPLADGPVIQKSSEQALKNGMNLKLLFEQLVNVRKEISIPILLMGYLNPILQFGMEKFIKKCKELEIDGLIIPDLPLLEFETNYKRMFDANEIKNIFLISPETKPERVKKIDEISDAFIYLVSSNSTTGIKGEMSIQQINYFKRIENAKIKNSTLIGFGISTANDFKTASQYANGAIVGSAFINYLNEFGIEKINDFIQNIKTIKNN